MPRIPRALRTMVALGFAALALTGCANKDVLHGASGHSTHTVRMTVTSSIFPTTLSYRINGGTPTTAGPAHAPVCATPSASNTSTTSTKATASQKAASAKASAADARCAAAALNSQRFAATTVTIRSGHHLSLTGGVPGGGVSVTSSGQLPAADSFTCSISVDGVLRTSSTASVPIGQPVPTCTAQGYIGSRPFQVTRMLEYLAVAFCLLVVVAGIALQFSPHRHTD